MTNRFGLMLILVMLAAPAFAQDTLWTRNYGFPGESDQGMCGCLTSDGGFIVSGYSVYYPGGDIWVVRADSNGDTLWTRNFGNSRWQQANHVIETSDGGAIVVGKFSVAVGDYDMYMIKLDANGDSLWTRRFGSAGVDDDGQAVIELADGGYLAVGAGRNAGSTDLFMVKVDASGDFLWQRYHTGSGSEYGYGVVELSDGGFAMTGTFGTAGGSSDIWLIRTDSSGVARWNRRYDFHGDLDRGDGIVMADNGDFVIGGRTWNTGRAQLLGLRVDSLGNQVWASEFGWLGDGEFAESIDKTPDGGFVIGGGKGYTTFDFYVVRLSSDGDSLWAAIYNGATSRSDDCYEIRVDPAGDIFAFGYTDIATANPSDLEYWVVKIHDNALQGAEPEIDVTPMAFDEAVEYGGSVSRQLFISNGGAGVLQYGLHSDQTWLEVLSDTGDVAPMGIDTIDVTMNAVGLDPQTYTGQISINSNDTSESLITLPVSMLVAGGDSGCVYVPGDINHNGSPNGIDIVYGVNYFKGGPPPIVDCGGICPQTSPFYAAGDVNGNCGFNGIDITFFVNYLKGIVPALLFCPSCPPTP